MIFKLVNADVSPGNPANLATVIFDFFLWQYKDAVVEEIKSRCELHAAESANAAAKQEYAKEGLCGFGAHLPYSSAALESMKSKAARTLRQVDEARALLDFVKDRIIAGFVQADSPAKAP